MKRRSHSRGSRAPTRIRKDWVYRPNQIQETPQGRGSYGAAAQHAADAGNGLSWILYDSVDYLKFQTESNDQNVGYPTMPRAARAEGSLPTVFMVEGQVSIRMTTWTLQSGYRFGMRLGWFEQDLGSGLLSLEAEYTLWYRGGFFMDHAPAMFANDKNTNMRTWRWTDYGEVASTSYSKYRQLMWRGRRRAPSSKHCLALYTELPADSPSLTEVEMWCRSLISDEG